MAQATKGKLTSRRIKRGPRKGQVVTGYLYPSGKFKELKGSARGGTAQRRRLARKVGLRDRFGHTAEDRSRIRQLKRQISSTVRSTKVAGTKLPNLTAQLKAARGPLVGPPKSKPTARAHTKKVVHATRGTGKRIKIKKR